jgi:hypothetical protein
MIPSLWTWWHGRTVTAPCPGCGCPVGHHTPDLARPDRYLWCRLCHACCQPATEEAA